MKKKYSLEFDSLFELKAVYEVFEQDAKDKHEKLKQTLIDLDVPFQILEPYGLAIDFDAIIADVDMDKVKEALKRISPEFILKCNEVGVKTNK